MWAKADSLPLRRMPLRRSNQTPTRPVLTRFLRVGWLTLFDQRAQDEPASRPLHQQRAVGRWHPTRVPKRPRGDPAPTPARSLAAHPATDGLLPGDHRPGTGWANLEPGLLPAGNHPRVHSVRPHGPSRSFYKALRAPHGSALGSQWVVLRPTGGPFLRRLLAAVSSRANW